MLWATMNMCFFRFLRAGEVCTPSGSSYDPSWHLCVQDLALDSHTNPTRLFVTIKASITDPFCQDSTITLDKTNQLLCPISAILPYVAIRGVNAGPLFCFHNGSFLTRDKFVIGVRRLLVAAGIDPNPYSGHNFRIGAATATVHAGMHAALHRTVPVFPLLLPYGMILACLHSLHAESFTMLNSCSNATIPLLLPIYLLFSTDHLTGGRLTRVLQQYRN